uniref:Uncharacterized protein n=1 Tax=Mus spicilegus TaxID=10103 RepID=A0A8C6IAQ6_MUSSI
MVQGFYFSPNSAVSTVMGPGCQNCPSDNENHCKNKRDPCKSYGEKIHSDEDCVKSTICRPQRCLGE